MNRIAILQDRASMLAKTRTFFASRKILEVDCPLITSKASVDAHIDLIPVLEPDGSKRWLHSSPEYGMKRLLSEGIGDIYQLAHVFRQGEYGVKHNPEFMMAEWYRLGIPFAAMIDETIEYIRLFLGNLPYNLISYRQAFIDYAGFDYVGMSEKDLLDYIKEKDIAFYPSIENEGKDALLNLILGVLIEPRLGENSLCALAYYPASQAALAQRCLRDREETAERFEVYYKGIELANGYHELADAEEQGNRLVEANEHRIALGKDPLPIDEHFLEALKTGLPDACGVAVGFDRLMMLRHNVSAIKDVMPFNWEQA
jgi:lysyl-tRNA synthetase class 2